MEEEKKGSLILDSRKKLTLSGVLEVISYDDEKIELNTDLGKLNVKGKNLKLNKLDVKNGDVIIIGSMCSIVYSNKNINKKSLIKKVFR